MDYVVDRTREINDPSAVLDAPSVGADGPSQHDTASAKGADSRYLERGTDVEIAHLIADELRRSHKPGVPFCEGEFWQYSGTHWEPIPATELRCHAHTFDGLWFGQLKPRQVRLTANRVDGILRILSDMSSQPNFFGGPARGINCASGFIQFDDDGTPLRSTHSPDHRQRHTLPGTWGGATDAHLPEGSLLHKLLSGCFKDDPDGEEKIALLQEVAGCAALGFATRLRAPKALVMLGPGAENGKGQVIDMMRGLLPLDAICSVSPGEFGDQHARIQLRSKLLNTSDELGTSHAIAGDKFKATITGDPISGRDLYRSRMEFRPEAQHVFAANELPTFAGGMDQGVLRRLLVMEFHRTIPRTEQVPHIGQRIATEEPDWLLAWAVAGAARLVRRGYFDDPAWSRSALDEWKASADPVLGWIEDRVGTGLEVVGEPEPRVTSKDAFDDFHQWHKENQGAAPRLSRRTFSGRLKGALKRRGVSYYVGGGFRGFLGMRLRGGQWTATEAAADLKRQLGF